MATIDPLTGLPTSNTPQSISASSLAPVTPLQIPAPNTNAPDYTGIQTGVTSQIANEYQSLQKQLDQAQAQQNQGAQSQLDIMGLLSDKTADTQAAQEQTGVNTETANLNKYAQQLADLNAQASSLQREAQAIPIQGQVASQGRGRTEAGLAPLTTAQLRDNSLKALSIGQQADIAAAAATGSQLRLNAAKDKAQQIVDLKYKPLEDQLAIKKQAYELNKDILSQIDKKRTEALTVALQKEERDLAEKKANEKAVSELMVTASQVAPPDVLARAKAIQDKGGSATDVAMALGQYGGDYYKTALLKEQIKTQQSQRATDEAQREKIYADIGVIQTSQSEKEVASWVSNIASGKAKLSDVPTKLKSLVSLGLSTATVTSPENKAKIEASQSVYNLAEELKTLEGKGGAVGAGAGKFFGAIIPGYDGTAFAGSDRANYEAKFKQLKDTLAASNLDKLKGAMSDKDIEFLRNIGTALNTDMSESAFDAELTKVQDTMKNVPGVIAKPVINKFSQSLGASTQAIPGTTYVKSVADDGSIDFNIPTK